MSTPLRYKLLRIALLCSIVMTMSLALVPGASANDRVPIPPGVLPIWARTACPTCVVHNDEWAAIPFYYDPDSEALKGFNLFDLIDPSLFDLGLPPTVTGFEIWEHWPPTAPAPLSLHWQGSGAVPVWFVPWGRYWEAAADGVMYMADLEALNPLKGTATSYKETLVLHGVVLGDSWVQQIQAGGVLEDGRTFAVQSTAHPPDPKDMQNTRIVFR